MHHTLCDTNDTDNDDDVVDNDRDDDILLTMMIYFVDCPVVLWGSEEEAITITLRENEDFAKDIGRTMLMMMMMVKSEVW